MKYIKLYYHTEEKWYQKYLHESLMNFVTKIQALCYGEKKNSAEILKRLDVFI